MSANAGDTKVSMLFSLLLARTSILSCLFYLFISVVKQKIEVKLALTIPTGAPVAVVKEIVDTPPLVAEKNKISSI